MARQLLSQRSVGRSIGIDSRPISSRSISSRSLASQRSVGRSINTLLSVEGGTEMRPVSGKRVGFAGQTAAPTLAPPPVAPPPPPVLTPDDEQPTEPTMYAPPTVTTLPKPTAPQDEDKQPTAPRSLSSDLAPTYDSPVPRPTRPNTGYLNTFPLGKGTAKQSSCLSPKSKAGALSRQASEETTSPMGRGSANGRSCLSRKPDALSRQASEETHAHVSSRV
eukprot:CAMPEP_0174699824 /NCGR_PEP_ID=MMETSP1094-20130205/4984_1 /TAXON_ID=156173 /ORGANISM="Chrysochromulina brevifilum, Strain UTEX LB 985" /LENGTH=220 /DNA_ID=CAMNT_0015897227 /DNA_START=17 /DNA_END=679 /DNA_ORIENTATION=-